MSICEEDPLSGLRTRAEHSGEICRILSAERGTHGLPTALVCANDAIAIAAMDVRLPEELSVTGFYNIEDAFHTSPRLTTVNVEKEMMGRRAAQLLFDAVRNGGFPKETVYMDAMPVHRDSTAVAPGTGYPCSDSAP